MLTEPTAQQLEANELGRVPVCGKPPPCKQAKSAPARTPKAKKTTENSSITPTS